MRTSRLYFSHLVRRQCPWESTQRENVAQLLHTPKLVQIFPCEKPYKSRYTETVLNWLRVKRGQSGLHDCAHLTLLTRGQRVSAQF